MPLQDYQKDWLIKQNGLDPSQYTLDDNEENIIPKPSKNQPSLGNTPYEPKLLANPGFTGLKSGNQNSALETFVKSFAESALPTMAGGAGAGIATAEMNPLAHVLPPWSEIGFGVGGALVGSALGRGVQHAIEPEAWQQNVAQAQAENPKSAIAGSLATLPLGGLDPNLGNIGSAVRALPKLATGLPATSEEIANLANVGIGAGLGAGQPLAEYAMSPEGTPFPTSQVVGGALGGAIFNDPNKLGQKLYGFHPNVTPQDEFSREMLRKNAKGKARTPAQIEDAEEVSATPGFTTQSGMQGPEYTPPAQLGYQEPTQLPEVSESTARAQRSADIRQKIESIYAKQQRRHEFDLAKQEKATQDLQEQVDDLSSQLQASQLAGPEQRPTKVETNPTVLEAQARAKEEEIANMPSDLEERRTEAQLAGEERPKYSEPSVLTPQQEATSKNLEMEGFSGELTPAWLRFAQKLGTLRNIKVLEDGSIVNTDTGKPVAGSTVARQGLNEVITKINPAMAGADTPVHEEFHSFINDMRQSPRARDQTLANKYDNLVSTHPDYLAWKAAREAKGLNSTVEEFQATNAGMESVNRAIANEGPWKKWWKDFSAYSKTRFGEHGTLEDFQRVMHYKLLHDPEFSKVFGGQQSTVGVGGAISNAEDSNLKNQDRLFAKNALIGDISGGEVHGHVSSGLMESHGMTGLNGGSGWRYRPDTNRVYWNHPPTPDEKIAVENWLAKKNIENPTHTSIDNWTNYKPDFRYAEESNLKPKTDYERYHEVQAEMRRAFNAGDNEALHKAFQENEDIKSKYNGMPPTKETDIEEALKRARPPSQRYSESSNLISPKDPEIIDLLDKARKLSDVAELEPEDAAKIHAILTQKVNWPKNSEVARSLARKDFDPMDPDHWEDLNKLYNAEQFQYENENEKPKEKSPKKSVQAKEEAPAPQKKVTAPSKEEVTTHPEPVKVSKAPAKSPGLEKAVVQGIEEKPYTVSSNEERYRKDMPSKQEAKNRELSAEAIKEGTDSLENQNAARAWSNALRKMYFDAQEKKDSATNPTDRDYQAARQMHIRSELYHIGRKWNIETHTEDLPKYSEESNLRPDKARDLYEEATKGGYDLFKKKVGIVEELIQRYKDRGYGELDYNAAQQILENPNVDYHKFVAHEVGDLDFNDIRDRYDKAKSAYDTNRKQLSSMLHIIGPGMEKENIKNQEESTLASGDEPRLNWRRASFEEDLRSHDLPYTSIGITRTLLDQIIQKHGPEGQAFSDAYNRYATDKDSMYGKYMAPILKAAKGMSPGDLNKVENIRILARRRGEDMSHLLTDRQKNLYDTIGDSMHQWQQDQIDANQPVSVMTPSGAYEKQLPTVDEFYHPNRPSPQAIEILTERPNSNAARDLRNDFINLQVRNGKTPELANKMLDSMIKSYDQGDANLNRFREVRAADKTQLPDSWMRNDLLKNLNGFFNRVASDRSFHDNFETNPDVAKSIGIEKDPWGERYAGRGHVGDLQGSTPVQNALEKIYGEPFDKDESNLKLANRIATALFLGPLTNIHIAASSVANALQYMHPTEIVPAMTKALTNITSGYEKALTQGYARQNLSKFSDILDVNNTAHERWAALGNQIAKINGRDATNAFTKGFLQNIGDWVIKSKMIAAEAGDRDAINLLKHVNPDWEAGRTFTPEEIDKMASSFAGMIHGTHDPRTLPGWMLKDTAIQPFFQLASWNIAQTNAWMRHVWTPAKNGNLTPFLMSTLGAVGGGYAISKLRELIGDKKGPIPSISEIINSSKGLEGNVPLDAYKAMALASYVGYGGILSTAAKAVGDIAFKNIPQSATFPLDEVISTLAHRPMQAIGAMINDPNIKSMDDYARVVGKLATDLVKENIQFGRIATSWLARNPDILKNENYYKELNQKTSELRRFKMVEGLPYDAQTASTGNPYMDLGIKQFKHTQDLGEAAKEAGGLVRGAIDQSQGNPDIMRAKLHKLNANVYETMPDPDTAPLMFKKYRDFLLKEVGPEETNNLIRDYYIKKAFNSAKSQMIPTV